MALASKLNVNCTTLSWMYINRVNIAIRRTKALELTVLPTRVGRSDVLKVFETIWKNFAHLRKDRSVPVLYVPRARPFPWQDCPVLDASG